MLKTALSLVAAAALALTLAIAAPPLAGADNIPPAAARQLVAGGARLVDVRTPEEFAAAHIAGALNIPVQELERRMGELGAKDRPIVLYCRSGNRSARAKQMLDAAGFTAVHDLGAMTRW